MATFNTQVIRIVADTTSKDNILDLNTSAEPEAWWARDLAMQVGVFAGAGLLNVSDIRYVVIYLKDPENLDGAPLCSKTITAFDNTTTLTTWQAGTQQHFTITFTADDLSFSLANTAAGSNAQRLVHLSMVAVTTGGKTGTLCVGSLNIVDDGGNSPGAIPVNAITVSQAQAMLAALSFASSPLALSAAGSSNIGSSQAWMIGRQPVALAAGSNAYVANLVLTDTNAIAGAVIRVPIDFPASANPTLNIYDTSTGGTLLQGPLINPNPAQAKSYYFQAGFDGINWHKETGEWVS